jgi:hypothetical protein
LGQTASKVALNGTKKCPKTLAREQINLLRAGDRRLTALVQRSLKWEIAAVFDTTGGSRAIRPRLTYTFNDRLKLYAGIDFFEGDSQTHFGSFANNRLAYMMLGLVF